MVTPETQSVQSASRGDRGPTLLDLLQRPGVQRLFVHDYAAVGVATRNAALGPAINRFAERALVLAQPGDVVVLAAPVEPAYRQYLEHIGIGANREDVVTVGAEAGPADGWTPLLEMLFDAAAVSRLAERLDRAREIRLSPYFASHGAFRLARQLSARLGREVVCEGGDSDAVVRANRKDLMREQARMLGVPVAPADLVSWDAGANAGFDPAAAVLEAVGRRRAATGAALLRGVWSMHGVDNLKITDGWTVEDLRAWLGGRPSLRSFLVEPLLAVEASPNVQAWIDDDAHVHLLDVTGQRLRRDLGYHGSAFPHASPQSAAILDSARQIATALGASGYRGPLGLDFIETRAEGAREHRLAEVNGRINGATYAIGLCERLNQHRLRQGLRPVPAWRTNSDVVTSIRRFDDLAERIGDLLYAPGGAAGVVPYNVGMLARGELTVLVLAGSQEEAALIEEQLVERLAD